MSSCRLEAAVRGTGPLWSREGWLRAEGSALRAGPTPAQGEDGWGPRMGTKVSAVISERELVT